MKKLWFYGIYGIEFVWHGSYADPEIIWHKKSFNYYDLENFLWDAYKEICTDENRKVNEKEFPQWVKKNAYIARDFLQELLDQKCFYGT